MPECMPDKTEERVLWCPLCIREGVGSPAKLKP